MKKQCLDIADYCTRSGPLGISRLREKAYEGVPSEVQMLIRYTCRDMGLKCPFVVKAETQEEVIQKALAHIREEHTDDV